MNSTNMLKVMKLHPGGGGRETSIDSLRCLGFLCIILVHINPPSFVAEFRIFDVCLMVFISAALYKPTFTIGDYYLKRFKRLVIPTWIFITVYMVFRFVSSNVLGKATPLNAWELINTYLLVDVHLGPIWVIRVFLLMALISPILYKISCLPKRCVFVFEVILLFIQTSLIHWINLIPNYYLKFYLDKYLLFLVGYSFIALAAISFKDSLKNGWIIFSLVCAISILLIPLFCPEWKGLQSYKYPPQSVYLIYGLVMSIILWFFKDKINYVFNNKICQFIGRNTLWIYFYHIVFVEIANYYFGNWIVKFIFVLILSVAFYYIQFYLANKYIPAKISKYLVG